LSHWLIYTVLWEVAAGVVLAALIGYAAGKTLRWAERRETMERTSILTVSLALSLTVLGVTDLAGMSGVLATFVAGAVFNATGNSDAKEHQEEVQGAITRFFDLPIFVLLGIALPWDGWLELGWSGVLLAAVLLLRRLPAVLALRPLLGELRETRNILFLGWFGPVGPAALYYAAFSLQETGIKEVWIVGSLIICASVLVHGLSDTPLTKLYRRFPRGD
jgi:NhaP-type Na+/H+ or K+/H+ antiporter